MGSLALNRFELEERLGSGGFGSVYRAWDPRLERHVAVKVIDAGADTGRVLREAQAAARLNHRGIVTLYELGEQGGCAYLVSELVDGSTLCDLAVNRELSDRDVGEVGADLCEALDHAHSRGVVHRDIKPQNVVVPAAGGQAKLLDFGIARLLDATGMTAGGEILGTIAYMAPEQAEGDEVGPPADVYSLALTLYECWSGENPNRRATPAATARALGEPVPSLLHCRRDLPPGLCRTIDACLDPDPAGRPGLEQLGEAIESSLEWLDDDRTVPEPRRPSALGEMLRDGEGPEAVRVAAAAAIGGLLAAAIIAIGPAAWALPIAPCAAGMTLLRPRSGYLLAVASLCAWLALVAGRPGSALVLAAIALPPVRLLPGAGLSLTLPAAAPALGALGLAPAFPILAAFAGRTRERAVLAATGVVWLVVAEVALRRELLAGPSLDAPAGWQESAGTAVTEVLLPLLTDPATLGLIVAWSLIAVIAGAVLVPLRNGLARLGGERRPARPHAPRAIPAAVGGNGRR